MRTIVINNPGPQGPVGPQGAPLSYKVYTALLTQGGTSSEVNKNSGDLTIGVTYRIDDSSGGADFTNVGAPNNNTGTMFVATGLVPTSYGTGNLTYDPGAPVVTVLENTIGNAWFTYEYEGLYLVNFTNDLDVNNTFVIVGKSSEGLINGMAAEARIESGKVIINTGNVTSAIPYNNQLYNTPIEIRVYN
jgi:hypothetical protein